MFADLALARRVELAAATLTAELVRALAEPRALVMPVGAGVAAFARPGSPLDKVIGVGLEGPIDAAVLSAVETAFDARGEPVRVELATLADPDVVSALSERGYALRGFENVLGRELASHRASSDGSVRVEPVDASTEPDWARVTLEGFATPDGTGAVVDELSRDAIAEAVADFARARSVRRWLARVDGEIAGSASAREHEGVLQLCGAATVPALRRRGVQRALFDARLEAGRAAGCDLAVITTAPGSQSEANATRRGFTLLYARAVLVRGAARRGA